MTVVALFLSIIATVASVVALVESMRGKRPEISVKLSGESEPESYIVRNRGMREAKNVRIVWAFDPSNTYFGTNQWAWSSLLPGQAVSVRIPQTGDKGVNDFHVMIENTLLRSGDREGNLSGTATFVDEYFYWKKSTRRRLELPVVTDPSSRDPG